MIPIFPRESIDLSRHRARFAATPCRLGNEFSYKSSENVALYVIAENLREFQVLESDFSFRMFAEGISRKFRDNFIGGIAQSSDQNFPLLCCDRFSVKIDAMTVYKSR